MPSLNTGGYAKARQRLPEAVLCQLFEHTGAALCAEASAASLWQGRAVKILDGFNVVMADSAANQADYPQHKTQKVGCGFPIAKLVVVFSLAIAAAIAVRIADFKTSEITLARQWYRTLSTNDIALADRAYGSYVDLALVAAQKADGVFRKHQRRRSDFRRGKRLGKGDHIIIWAKPGLLADADQRRRDRYGLLLLEMVAKAIVPFRPDRHEPRTRKRRLKAFPSMNEPRASLKQRFIAA